MEANPTPSFWREACRGTAAGRTMAAHNGNINEKWFWHHYSRSTLVGKGYVMRSRGHIPANMIDESRLAEMVPDTEVAALRAHVGLEPVARESGETEGEREHPTTTGMGTTATTSEAAATIGDLDHLDRARVKREAAADASDGRTVRQRVADIERRQQGQPVHAAAADIAMATAAAASAPAPAAGAEQAGMKRGREVGDDGDVARRDGDKRANVGAALEMTQAVGDPEPWMREPAWMPIWMHKKKSEVQPTRGGEQDAALGAPTASSSSGGARPDADRSHHMMNVGSLLFCNRCGAYGFNRAGAKLTAPCTKTVSRDVKKRLERMRAGLHPITGASIG